MFDARPDGSLRVLLQFLRAAESSDPYAFAFKPQDYILPTADGDSPSARFDWTPELLADLEAVRRPGRDPEVVQRVGERLRSFVQDAGWAQLEIQIAHALAAHRPVFLTIRSSAAELYALPWELLTLKSGQFLGELDGLLIRFEWPASASTPAQCAPRPEGGRILVAWSAAGGAVPASDHIQAISAACTAGFHPFQPSAASHPALASGQPRAQASDVLHHASLDNLVQRLEEARRTEQPIAVLHLLCHGAATGSTFGLALSGEDDAAIVDATELRRQLAPFSDMVRLIVLSACDSGNQGALGSRLGSIAQALHRCGFAAVIASRYPLSVAGSIVLTESFYSALLLGPASLETAFLAARKRLGRSEADRPRASRALDWASLQLYARHADGDDTRPVVFRPFRGLLPFQPEHRRFFFGRDREVAEVLGDLQALLDQKKERFLVVAGASGTGKSSLVFAGAVPKLLAADPQLVFLRMRPGSDPEPALAEALQKRPPGAPGLLVVDQFEELFTQTAAAAVREAFTRRLWSLAQAPESDLRVLITLRIDFIGRCGELVINDAGLRLDRIAYDEAYRVFVAQLQPEQLRAAIVEPARKVGLELQAGLADRMIQDVGSEPGALPLLADVLDELWLHRQDRLLTQAAYDELGGVVGALRLRADAILGRLAAADLAIAKRLLVSLVAVADDMALDTRASVALVDLRDVFAAADAAGFERVLKEMVAARLLVQDGDEQATRVEVAHEALIRKWPRLRTWLDEDRAGLLIQRRVRQAAQHWERQQSDESLLYRGGQLAQTSEWRKSWESRLGALEQRFLDASEALRVRTAEEAEAQLRAESARREQILSLQIAKQQQRTRLLRIGIMISSAFTLFSFALVMLAVSQTRVANQRGEDAVKVASQIVLLGDEKLGNLTGGAEVRYDLRVLSSKLLTTLRGAGDSGADDVQVWLLIEQADLLRSKPESGELQRQEATRLYEQALALTLAHLSKTPRDGEWLRNRAVSCEKLGDMLQMAGQLPAATRRYEESLASYRKVLDSDPSNISWERELAKSRDADPSTRGWRQRDLARAASKLGDMLELTGRLSEAIQCYEEALAIRQQLADPSKPEWQRILVSSSNKLGLALEKAGQLDQARQQYEQALAMVGRRLAENPADNSLQRDLLVGHLRLIALLRRPGVHDDGHVALRHHEDAARTIVDRFVREQLFAEDPVMLQAQRMLTTTPQP